MLVIGAAVVLVIVALGVGIFWYAAAETDSESESEKKWATWQRILGQGRVFTRDDLASLAHLISFLNLAGAAPKGLDEEFCMGHFDESRITPAKLVEIYGPPDKESVHRVKTTDIRVYHYGQLGLCVSMDRTKVYSDALCTPVRLWLRLYKFKEKKDLRKTAEGKVQDLELPDPLAGTGDG